MLLDINKQRVPYDYLEFYEVQTGTSTYSYFTNYESNLWFADREAPYTRREYIALPIEFSGFEQQAEGAYARPQVTFSNVLRTLPNILTTNDALIGNKITRRRTISKHLPTQSAGTGPAPTELPRQVFYFDRVVEENAVVVTFELTTAFDLQNVRVPNRYILANVCTWLYQGAADDLSSGTPLGGCNWREDNILNGDSSLPFYFDIANRVLLDNGNAGSATTMPGSGTLTANHLYSKSITLNYTDDSGTDNTNEYFQALGALAASPFNVQNFRRVRMYTTWNSGTSYKTYKEGRVYNPCVLYDEKVWVAVQDNTNVTPGTDDTVWERIDICGKRLSSCASRYSGVKFTGQSGVVIPSATEENREAVLPYGGFPAAKRYNR